MWTLPWFVVDMLLRDSTWLGPRSPGGLKEAYPGLWLIGVAGTAGLMGYQSFKRSQSLRVPRMLAMAAFVLVFFAGYGFLGGRAWGFAVAGVFVTLVALEAGAYAIGRRKETSLAGARP
jgi:hypothetical protein